MFILIVHFNSPFLEKINGLFNFSWTIAFSSICITTIILYNIVCKIHIMTTKCFRIKEESVKKLDWIKENRGINPSWLVNKAIVEYIKKHDLYDEGD